MVFSVRDVKTLLGNFAEPLTCEIEDTRVGFFEMLTTRKNRRVYPLGKWRLGPQDRNLNGTIAEKADFVATLLQSLQYRYRLWFGIERTPDLIQSNLDRFRHFFGRWLNAGGSANVR